MSNDIQLKEMLNRFAEIAENPKTQFLRYIKDGKKIVLTAPEYTPAELIHSLGMVPFGAWGADIALGKSKQYFPAFICSILQSVLELGMRGTYEGASAIVIPSFCDSLKAMGENWKYAVPGIPFVPMVYPQNRKIPAAKAFTVASYMKVAKELSETGGNLFLDASLQKSINLYNKHNVLMRKLDLLISGNPVITPSVRSLFYKSAFFTTVEEHIALLKELIGILQKYDECDGAPKKIRIVTSGILTDSPSLLEALTFNGFQIVADDVAAESRQYFTDAPKGEDALLRLAEKYCAMEDCSLLYDPEKKRIERLIKIAKDRKADGVLLILTKFCDPEEYDIPFISKRCKEAELPFTLIEVDRQMTEYAQARTAIEAFREMIS